MDIMLATNEEVEYVDKEKNVLKEIAVSYENRC